MSRARRILSNTAWLTAGQLVTTVAALFVTGKVAELLGPIAYGEMELAQSMVNFFSPIIFAGIQIPLINTIVSNRADGPRAFGDAILIRLLVTPVFVAVAYLGARLLIPYVDFTLVWLAIAYWWLIFFFQSLTVPVEAAERMHFMGIGTIIMTTVGMVLSLAVVYNGLGNTWVLGARVTGMAVCFLYMVVVIAVTFYRPRFQPELKRYKEIGRRGLPLALSFLLGLLLLEQDKVMFAWFLPESYGDPTRAVGLYQSATVLAYKFEMIVIPLATAITPPLVDALEESAEGFEEMLGKALRVALILGLPVAVGTGFIASDIMEFIFDDDYLAAAPVLTILVWFVPLQFLNRVMAAALAVHKRENWVAIAVLLAVIINFVANALLIPQMQVVGAAYATIASEVILVLIYFIVLRDHFVGVVRELKLVRLLVSVALMALVCTLMLGLNALLIIGAAAVVYGAAVLGTKAVTKSELQALRGG